MSKLKHQLTIETDDRSAALPIEREETLVDLTSVEWKAMRSLQPEVEASEIQEYVRYVNLSPTLSRRSKLTACDYN